VERANDQRNGLFFIQCPTCTMLACVGRGRAERPKAASGTGPAKDTATENSEPPTDEEASQRVRSTTTGSAAEPRGRRAQVAESRRSAPLQNAASLMGP
jgi:hypothetical protein